MSDDLEALRKAVEAFGRRKNELSSAGQVALNNVSFNLKRYAEAYEGVLEARDVRFLDVVRKIILEDIGIIEADLKR